MAAAEGSRLLLSWSRESFAVGEMLFGLLLLRNRRFVENLRDRPDDLMASGTSSGVGKGSERFLRSLMMGRTSSRSLRFSSDIRMSSSRRARSSASRSLIMWMMRAISSCVGAESWVSASAASKC